MLGTPVRSLGSWRHALLALAMLTLPSCCKKETPGCSSDVDCKGDRVCEEGQCVEGKAPGGPGTPGAGPVTAWPEPTPADPIRTIERRYRCADGSPTAARGGCSCDGEIRNLCYCAPELPCSPDFRVEGDTCIFQCPMDPPSLGGTPGRLRSTSHMGEELYFIVGGTYSGMREAQQDYDRRKGAFGDMQDYFVVRRTDELKGMQPGFWVVAEAHRCKPNEETQMFAKRAFPQAYVKRATPTTPEPLPVYEDNVPAASCDQ